MAETFNEAELLSRVDNDVAFLAETVQMLETDGRTLMAEIRKHISAADAPAVGRSGHALKGMISNFCAPDAQSIALEIEKSGKAGDIVAATAAADRLQPRLDKLIEELQNFVKVRS